MSLTEKPWSKLWLKNIKWTMKRASRQMQHKVKIFYLLDKYLDIRTSMASDDFITVTIFPYGQAIVLSRIIRHQSPSHVKGKHKLWFMFILVQQWVYMDSLQYIYAIYNSILKIRNIRHEIRNLYIVPKLESLFKLAMNVFVCHSLHHKWRQYSQIQQP